MNVKISQKHDNVYYIRKNYALKSIYDDENECIIYTLSSISVETLRIDNGYSLEKEFTVLIRKNPWMVLQLIFNQVDLCHNCVCRPLTQDTKGIL